MNSCSPGSSLLGFRAEHLFQFVVAPPCHLQGERQDYINPRLGWSSSFTCLLRGLWRNAPWFENTSAYRIVIVAPGDGSKKNQLLLQKLGTERSTSRSRKLWHLRLWINKLKEFSKCVVSIAREIRLAVVCPLSPNMPKLNLKASENQRKTGNFNSPACPNM